MNEMISREQVVAFIKENYCDSIKLDPSSFYLTVREKFKVTQSVRDQRTGLWNKIVKFLPDAQIMEILYFAKKKNLDPLMKDFYVFQQKDGNILPYLSFEAYFSLFKQYVPSKYAFHIEEGGWIDFTFTPKTTDSNKVSQPKTIKVPSCLTCVLKDKSGLEVARLTEYYAENFTGSTVWQDSPFKMLRNKVIAQTVRILLGEQGAMLDENDIEIIKERERMEMESEAIVPTLPTAEELLHTLNKLGINGFVQGDRIFVDKRYGHNNFNTLIKLGFIQGSDGCFYQKCASFDDTSAIQQPYMEEVEAPKTENLATNTMPTPPTVEEAMPSTPIVQENPLSLNGIENSLKESGVAFETKMKDGKCYLLVKEANDNQIIMLQGLGFVCKKLQTSGENVWAKIF